MSTHDGLPLPPFPEGGTYCEIPIESLYSDYEEVAEIFDREIMAARDNQETTAHIEWLISLRDQVLNVPVLHKQYLAFLGQRRA